MAMIKVRRKSVGVVDETPTKSGGVKSSICTCAERGIS